MLFHMGGSEDILIQPCEREVELNVGSGTAGRKFRRKSAVDLGFEFFRVQISGGNAEFLRGIGKSGNAVVGGESNPGIGEAHMMTEEAEKVGEFAIQRERHGSHLGRIRADLMAEN